MAAKQEVARHIQSMQKAGVIQPSMGVLVHMVLADFMLIIGS